MHELKLSRQTLNSTVLECGGDPTEQYEKNTSLVITRDPFSEGTGRVTFIPSRMLYGLMPSSLINQYKFWQNEDDSLTGYMPLNSENSNKSVSRSIVFVKLHPEGAGDPSSFCNAHASATISRTYITETSTLPLNMAEFETTPDFSKPVMYLVNLLDVLGSYVTQYNTSGHPLGPVSRVHEMADFEGENTTLHALVSLLGK